MVDFQDEIRTAAESLKAEQELLSSEEAIASVICHWLESSIATQLEDINWHYANSPLFRKLFKAPELAAERQLLATETQETVA